MKLPRDVAGRDLARALPLLGYQIIRLTEVAVHFQLEREEVMRRLGE